MVSEVGLHRVISLSKKALLLHVYKLLVTKIAFSCNSALTFGTLDIALPSEKNRMAIVVTHDGESQSIIDPGLSKFDCSAVAWVSMLCALICPEANYP
jgi:hypothetical protein